MGGCPNLLKSKSIGPPSANPSACCRDFRVRVGVEGESGGRGGGRGMGSGWGRGRGMAGCRVRVRVGAGVRVKVRVRFALPRKIIQLSWSETPPTIGYL